MDLAPTIRPKSPCTIPWATSLSQFRPTDFVKEPEFVQHNVIKSVIIKHPRQAEVERVYNYPYAAIEELLVNAVYHRSYEIREPIELRILPDRVTIASYPGPDASISLQDLSAGYLLARRYRNRRIGEFLKELRLTEGRGTGIPKVIRAMRENGSLPPKFQTDEERTYFAAVLPIHPKLRGNLGEDVGEKSPKLSPKSVQRHVLILRLCRSPQSRVEIQHSLLIKDPKQLREQYLAPLIAQGHLTMTEPNHPTSRSQRYQTTQKGEAYLRKAEMT